MVFEFFVPFNGIEWYFKLPLTVPLSPSEIPLNGPMILNGIQWYTTGSFCKGSSISMMQDRGRQARRTHESVTRLPCRGAICFQIGGMPPCTFLRGFTVQ